MNSGKQTICFITMCKNEEHCIGKTLESVYKLIDYWIVCDTGSTDNTCKIVKDFFNEKNIPGELYIDEWIGFDKNKTLMFERAHNKTDYVLHLDADDFIEGVYDENTFKNLKDDMYFINTLRGTSKFRCSYLYNNRLKWLYAGVAHNIIVCLDKEQPVHSNIFVTNDMWVDANERGSRKNDPNKYINDALKLREQFFDTLYEDPYGLNSRSVFYAANSYMDSGNFKDAIQWYTLYTKLKETWIEELFQSHLNIALCMIRLNVSKDDKIKYHFDKAIDIFPDRAEPYYNFGKYYNDKSNTELGYAYLKEAQRKNYDEVIKKYILFVNYKNYGKYLNDELSVSCFWTDRGHEGYSLLCEIVDDPDFENDRERLLENKKHFNNKYYTIV